MCIRDSVWLGDGITGTDADLVVTPERVESAIHNLTDDAITDVQETLGIGDAGVSTFLGLTDAPDEYPDGSAGQVVQINSTSNGLEFGTGGSLHIAGYEWDTEETDAGEPILIMREISDAAHEVVRFVRNADHTYDIVATGYVRAGG